MPEAAAVLDAPSDTNGRRRAGTNQIRRRTTLPSGRAVVGALLMTVAAVGIFLAYTDATSEPTKAYAVASRDLDAGTVLSADHLDLEVMDLAAGVASGAFVDLELLEGRRLLAPLLAGDLVQASGVSDRSAGDAEVYQVSFAVSRAASVNGLVRRGDLVDVYVTFDDRTDLVVRRVEVLQAPDSDDDQFGSRDEHVVVIQLPSAAQVVRVVHAMQSGEMTIVRSTFADPADVGPDGYEPGSSGNEAGEEG